MQFSQSFTIATLALAGAATAKEIIVQVSNQDAKFFYNKDNIKADVGDTVKFIFNPANHTVTESAFTSPCQPLANGFNSGFRPVQKGAATQDTFTYSVVDDKPHWFYCAQGRHCQAGMVGVINAPAAKPENNINSFKVLAAKANATIPAPAVAGGWLGSVSSDVAAGYMSQAGATWTPPAANDTAAPTATQNMVYNTNAPAPTVIQTEWTYTNSKGQVVTTSVAGTVKGWAPTTYAQAWTTTAANGVVQTGVAQVTANVPQIAQSNDAPAGFRVVSVGAGALALAAAVLML